jgi:hypothetical protein
VSLVTRNWCLLAPETKLAGNGKSNEKDEDSDPLEDITVKASAFTPSFPLPAGDRHAKWVFEVHCVASQAVREICVCCEYDAVPWFVPDTRTATAPVAGALLLCKLEAIGIW